MLTEPRNAVLKQFEVAFRYDDVQLHVTESARRAIARDAHKRGTGARGLRSRLKQLLSRAEYEAPQHAGCEVLLDAGGAHPCHHAASKMSCLDLLALISLWRRASVVCKLVHVSTLHHGNSMHQCAGLMLLDSMQTSTALLSATRNRITRARAWSSHPMQRTRSPKPRRTLRRRRTAMRLRTTLGLTRSKLLRNVQPC